MESSQKKIISAYALLLLGIVLVAKVIASPEYSKPVIKDVHVPKDSSITCWYTGEENRIFFEECADDFRDETGIAVTLKEQPSLNYFSEIYDAVKNEVDAPDVYLLEAEDLEQAYYCQLLEKNKNKKVYATGFAQNAIKAASRGEDLYGYPLYFNTTVFAYRTDYFETAPKSVQEMIDYSVDHEPGEGVEKLLEWNLADGFYNFPFFGAAVQIEDEEAGTISWSYKEDAYETHKTFFGNLTAAIELDENTINNKSVCFDFENGKTVAVFLDTDDIANVKSSKMKIAKLPKLNEELAMIPAAKTTLLCVNGMSGEKALAGEFANYVAVQKADKLRELTGHISVKENALVAEEEKIAFMQYEEAVLKPNALNATDFWVKFQNDVLQIWNDAE